MQGSVDRPTRSVIYASKFQPAIPFKWNQRFRGVNATHATSGKLHNNLLIQSTAQQRSHRGGAFRRRFVLSREVKDRRPHPRPHLQYVAARIPLLRRRRHDEVVEELRHQRPRVIPAHQLENQIQRPHSDGGVGVLQGGNARNGKWGGKWGTEWGGGPWDVLSRFLSPGRPLS